MAACQLALESKVKESGPEDGVGPGQRPLGRKARRERATLHSSSLFRGRRGEGKKGKGKK